MKKFFLIICALLGLNSCAKGGEGAQYQDMNVAEFEQLIANPDVQILDVRTPEEYASGHIPGAVNINVFDSDFMQKVDAQTDKSRPVAVYCRSGKRSANAATQMSKAGYDVTNLKGGINAWASGHPLER